MVAERDKTDQDLEEEERAWLGFAKFLLLLMMTVMFLMLGQSMVQHHFFTGGELNNRDAAVGP
jgi:hypothetical protein